MASQLWFLLLVPGLPLGALLLWMRVTTKKREQQFRRPFDEMPRPAGYSLQKRTAEIMDQFTEDLMLIIVGGGVSWALWLSDKNLLWVALALGMICCSVFTIRAKRRIITCSNHRLGLLGEQVVGLILDRLSSDSIRVFHDLEVIEPGKKPWNIDHVVLTPAGVFAIETKTRRKPKDTGPGGQAGHKVIFDGRQLLFPAPMQADRHGLEQAQNNADWLAGKLTELNGTPIPVSPVLVLPGWWVEGKGKGSVAALNPKGLPSFLTGRPNIFADKQFRAINAQLEERSRIDLTR
jgi:hypothetical protein